MSEDDQDENPCPHGEQTRSRCKICKDVPLAKRVVVHFSAGGTHYHKVHDCEALEYGQQQVDDRGGLRAEIKWTYEDLIKDTRDRCTVCFYGAE